jgi:hypothetical protein
MAECGTGGCRSTGREGSPEIFRALRAASSPDKRSDIRGDLSTNPACRFAHAGYFLLSPRDIRGQHCITPDIVRLG